MDVGPQTPPGCMEVSPRRLWLGVASFLGASKKWSHRVSRFGGFCWTNRGRFLVFVPGGFIICQGNPSISPERTPMKVLLFPIWPPRSGRFFFEWMSSLLRYTAGQWADAFGNSSEAWQAARHADAAKMTARRPRSAGAFVALLSCSPSWNQETSLGSDFEALWLCGFFPQRLENQVTSFGILDLNWSPLSVERPNHNLEGRRIFRLLEYLGLRLHGLGMVDSTNIGSRGTSYKPCSSNRF